MTFEAPSSMRLSPSVDADEAPNRSSPLSGVRHRFQCLADRWVGFWESRRLSPSPRAWAEALDYYGSLYQTKGPDPEAFRRLLTRNGVPTWRNPFPEGEAQHFLYHPEGLVLADLEAILEDLALNWKNQQEGVPEEKEPPDEFLTQWPTMEEALQLRELETTRRMRHWSRLSAVCWGMLLLQAKNLDGLRERVHEDNLAWATVHAWKVAPWEMWKVDPARVLEAAVRLGVLSEKVKQNLLSSRSEASVEQEEVRAS
jgi:hypothetical protein